MKHAVIAMTALSAALTLGGCGGPYASGAYPYYGSYYDAYYAPYSYPYYGYPLYGYPYYGPFHHDRGRDLRTGASGRAHFHGMSGGAHIGGGRH